MTPILPFINDTVENIDGLLKICVDCGVKGIITFGGLGVTLRDGDRQYFYRKLDEHFPGMKQRYIRTFGDQYIVPSPHSAELMERMRSVCEARGIMWDTDAVFEYLHAYEDRMSGTQLSLFE